MSEAGATLSIVELDRPPGVGIVRGRDIANAFPWHVHDTYCLGRVEAGTRILFRASARIVVPAGGLFLIHPGESHRCESADPEGHAYTVVCMPPAVVARAAGSLDAPPAFVADAIADDTLSAAFSAFLEAADDTDDGLRREVACEELLGRLILGHAAADAWSLPSPRAVVRRVKRYVDLALDDDLTLERLAAVACLSPFHFQRVFHRETGMALHAYVMQRRVWRAMERVAAGDPLADIAAACGFADQSHLTRVFRRMVGVTPAKLRKTAKGRVTAHDAARPART